MRSTKVPGPGECKNLFKMKINSTVYKLQQNFITMVEDHLEIAREKELLTRVLHLALVPINNFPSFCIEFTLKPF